MPEDPVKLVIDVRLLRLCPEHPLEHRGGGDGTLAGHLGEDLQDLLVSEDLLLASHLAGQMFASANQLTLP